MIASTMVRMAQRGDVAAIVSIVNDYAAEAVMLPISAERVALSLDDFVVATDARGRVRACGALKEYSPSLAEVASLAVARDAHGSGIGRAIVSARAWDRRAVCADAHRGVLRGGRVCRDGARALSGKDPSGLCELRAPLRLRGDLRRSDVAGRHTGVCGVGYIAGAAPSGVVEAFAG